jgi:hypothetical protein
MWMIHDLVPEDLKNGSFLYFRHPSRAGTAIRAAGRRAAQLRVGTPAGNVRVSIHSDRTPVG